MLCLLRQFFVALPVKLREADKIKHMVWSFWLTSGAMLLLAPVLALSAVFLLGLAKECWDEFYGSGFCFYDITGNLVGSLAGFLCASVGSSLLLSIF